MFWYLDHIPRMQDLMMTLKFYSLHFPLKISTELLGNIEATVYG